MGSDTYTLSYDVENHLVEVEKNGSGVANFAYGPEGGRISGTVNGVTTIYVGNHYEVEQGSPETVRKYYYANGKRVAMRQRCGAYRTVNWLLSDHPSTSLRAPPGEHGDHRRHSWQQDRRGALRGLRGRPLHLGLDADDLPLHRAKAGPLH